MNKKNMKKKLLLLFSLFICKLMFSQDVYSSDISLYREIGQSFESRYYPKTIEKADLLMKLYPDSVFMKSALVYKAKSLIKLKYYDKSVPALKEAISYMYTGDSEFTLCHYMLGMSYFNLENYTEALDSFYISCRLSLINDDMKYYHSAIFYSAECYYRMGIYDQSASLYEHVIENGNEYTEKEYRRAVENLVVSYEETEDYDSTINLFNAFDLSSDFFDEELVSLVSFSGAEAYKQKELYDNAYNIYSDLTELENDNIAAKAINNILDLYKNNNIKTDVKEIDSKITSRFKENETFLDNFCIRLGIDEYNNNNFEKSLEYFSNIHKSYDIVNIYKAKIILDTDDSEAGGKKAEEILLSCENIDKNDVVQNISDSYYSLLLQCRIQQDKWDNIPEIFGKIQLPGEKEIYINSSYYYKMGIYEKVEKETGVLYGSALCRLGRFPEACAVFEELDKNNKLDENYLIEYGKALFAVGQYEEAYNTALGSNDYHKEYLCGLCKINLSEFETARDYFMSYIRKMSNNESFYELAFYYKGYVEYLIGEYRNAYASFVRFIHEASDRYASYKGYSYKYAAISAVENGDFANAIFYAENIINIAKADEDKINAVRFYFEVLTDCNEYEKSIELLIPYTITENSSDVFAEFKIEALFRIAGAYEKLEDSKLAEFTYKKVYTDYKDSPYAEDALYRSCEIYYFKEDYNSAYIKFNDYVYLYPNGKFTEAALYFSGDSALKLGEINKSIMINKNLVSKFPNSNFAYGSGKNLLIAYYEQEDYEYALSIAQYLRQTYEKEAAIDKIDLRITELERIVGGTDKQIAEKLSEYERLGTYKTKEGRVVGSEIVKLYAADKYMQDYAYELAIKLLENQRESDELLYAAENAEFVGYYCRENYRNKEAADYYLVAAEYYRGMQNSIKAAAVLYGASEAFMAAGLKGDAMATAELLKELYPYSKYAESVGRIVR